MKKMIQGLFLLAFIGVAGQLAWSMTPCEDVDRSLSNSSKAALSPIIASQLHAKKVDVLQSFKFAGWSIIYVDTHDSDEAFLFYSSDPLRSQYLTVWSGAAAWNEEQSIKAWALKNAPGIPPKLAACFAWHVTKDRDQ